MLRSTMLPAYGSGPASLSPSSANSSSTAPSEGVNAPVCGEPVPASGINRPAAAGDPTAIPADPVKAHAATARTAPSASLVLLLSVILSPYSYGRGPKTSPAAFRSGHAAPLLVICQGYIAEPWLVFWGLHRGVLAGRGVVMGPGRPKGGCRG